MPSTGKQGVATRARRPGIRTAEGRGMAVSGLGKDAGDVCRLMNPGIMGKGTRYSYGYCWESFRGHLFSHAVGGLRCRLRASRGRVRAVRQDEECSWMRRCGRWTTTSEPERDDEVQSTLSTDGASTVLDVP